MAMRREVLTILVWRIVRKPLDSLTAQYERCGSYHIPPPFCEANTDTVYCNSKEAKNEEAISGVDQMSPSSADSMPGEFVNLTYPWRAHCQCWAPCRVDTVT